MHRSSPSALPAALTAPSHTGLDWWVALTAAHSACCRGQLGVLAWASSTMRTLSAGSRPLCLRAVVCCPAPSSACALRGRRHQQQEVLLLVDTMRIQLYGARRPLSHRQDPTGGREQASLDTVAHSLPQRGSAHCGAFWDRTLVFMLCLLLSCLLGARCVSASKVLARSKGDGR